MTRVYIAILGFVCQIAWTQEVSPEIVQHVKAGMAAQSEGRLEDAIREFRAVTVLAPGMSAAFVNLGAAYIQSRDYAAAIEPLKHALDLNPELPGAHQMLGFALLAQGYPAEAIPHFEKAGARDGLGIAQLETGKLPEAIGNLRAALADRPNDPDLLYYLGRASGLLSKDSFDTLLSAYPGSPRAHQALAENYAALKRTKEAIDEYREALRLRPDLPGIHLALGLVYSTASDWTNAETELRTEAKLQPGNAEAAYLLGSTLLQQGKGAEARKELDRANTLRPGMSETLYALGKAALLAGDTGAAEKAWTSLLAIETAGPLAAQTHFALAGMYRKQGKAAEADREMNQFRKLRSAAVPRQ